MELPQSKYFLGATIINQGVLSRVQKYENEVRKLFGIDATTNHECHITILPPFQTNYITASHINVGCAVATLLSNHPLVRTLFSIRQLDIMSYSDLDHLHFPLQIIKEPSLNTTFSDYVKVLRKKVGDFGIDFKKPIPNEFSPHITVFSGKNLKQNNCIQAMLAASKLHAPLLFSSGYPTLYTKYSDRWTDLTNNPNSDDIRYL